MNGFSFQEKSTMKEVDKLVNEETRFKERTKSVILCFLNSLSEMFNRFEPKQRKFLFEAGC